MSDFKGRHFGGEIVLWAVRWYRRYPISYRDLETMMTERGVSVDHSTIYRRVQHFTPEIERRLRWQWRRPRSRSWRIDETFVKVRGKWAYLYRALDKLGNTIDFYLSATRSSKAAKRFLGKALRGLKDWEQPEVLNTDKAPTYAAAIAELKAEGNCPNETRHRQVKYLRGIGITEYLRNGGDLEVAARSAGHESSRTTQLYNRLQEEISLDEIERIHI